MKTPLLSLLAATSAFVGLEGSAAAADFYDFIPASACQIRYNADLDKADLVDGSWQINAGVTGDVELICPLRIDSQYWNGGEYPQVVQWGYFDIFYRDVDASADECYVGAYLDEVDDFTAAITNIWSIATLSEPLTTDTRYLEEMPDDNLGFAYHYVRVKLRQNCTNNRMRLTAVHFWMPEPG